MSIKLIIGIILLIVGIAFAAIGGTEILALTILAFPIMLSGVFIIMADSLKKNSIKNREAVVKIAKAKADENGAIFFCVGSEGRILSVYEDRVSLVSKPKILVGNFANGEKTIYYKDCIGLQFNPSPSSQQLGYLQFETASTMTNNSGTYYNENTFGWYLKKSEVTNETMQKVNNFVHEKVAECKKTANTINVTAQQSNADELKKYKELLDLGIITQEEFDTKKKQLLGL